MRLSREDVLRFLRSIRARTDWLKEGYKAGIYSEYSKDVIRPSAKECAQNGRARSTKMRYARKGDL